jgi:RNA 2',3'-cyclic 3'-phosphodiesterase
MNLRLFVALDPPDAVRRRLAALQAEVKKGAGRAASEVKWVAAENIHLTLQFLGAVPEERVDDVKRAVADAAAVSTALDLEVRGTGGFPNARRPRVVWAGLAGDVERLTALVQGLGAHLAPLGFPPEERPFSPHLTLGRAREPRGAPGLAAAIAQAAELPSAPWRASDVVLFQSHLSPMGARYEAVLRAPLGGTASRP